MHPSQTPIVVGATGGSGTRIFARFLERAGVYLGVRRNDSEDALEFVEFLDRWIDRYAERTRRPLSANERSRMVGELRQCVERHRVGLREPAAPWGWKEPRTIFLLPFLHEIYPRLRFLHVVRDGRDMAWSSNQNQLRKHGPAYLSESERRLPEAEQSLLLWARNNGSAADYGESRMSGAYLRVKYEDLCAAPVRTIERVLAFVGAEADARAIAEEVRETGGIGRWVEHASVPAPAEVTTALRRLEYDEHGSTGVFVLGMHRGGTSTITRVVNLLGLPLGDPADWMPPSPDNPKGYWESLALSAFNEELLWRLGGAWSSPPALPPGWEQERSLESWAERARRLFRRIHPTPLWVWKDPRTSTTLPFWVRALRVRPLILLAHRHPLEIARSLEKRDEFSKLLAVALWERTLRSVVAAVRGLPVFVVPYAEFVEEPLRWMEEIRRFLERHGVPCERHAAPAEIAEFVEPSLRHSAYDPAAFRKDPEVSAAQRALFAVLEERIGPNDAFPDLELPPETLWTGPLLGERHRGYARERELREAHEERSRLERSVSALLRWVPGPTDAASPEERGRRPGPVYGPDAEEDHARYAAWLARREPKLTTERETLAAAVADLDRDFRLSVVVSLEGARRSFFDGFVETLRRQIFSAWQLCVGEHGHGDPSIRSRLEELTASDPRVRVVASAGGPSAARNAALELAEGKFVCFLGAEDELEPEALAEVAIALCADPEIDVLYTDEDTIDEEGRRVAPFFKPDWSPDHLLSQMYVGTFLVIRRALLDRIGRFRSAYDAAEDWDLSLRATEMARRIAHVPKVLCHVRARPPSPDRAQAARRALESAMERRGEDARVQDGLVSGTFRVRRRLRSTPLLSIVIPFRDRADLLRRCLESIHAKGGYESWEALLVDNLSWEPETRALLGRLATDSRCRIFTYSNPFNWAAINNFAVDHARGDVLLFLNNDVEAISDGWLAALLEHAERPEVGAVGARLLYEDGRVQHAGVLIGVGPVAGHSLRFCPQGHAGYFGFGKIVRNYTAVTGACMMVRRDVFTEVGPFDPTLAVAYNDIDFCLRLQSRGYRIVYTPFAELFHYEAVSRGVSIDSAETPIMIRRWGQRFERDPHFNPNLSLRREDFSLPADDDEVPLWKELLSTLEN